MDTAYEIPPLLSGGVMLSFRCSSACRHCLYRCSPRHPNVWMTRETAERVFNALGEEPHLQSVHIAGGEPGLKMDLLEEVIQLAVRNRVPLSYVETNASWCTNRETAREKLLRLRDAGLPAILVSVSMFHNEFIPFRSTRTCVEVAEEVFGRSGVIVYMPHMYELLSRLPEDRTHTLEEFCQFFGVDSESPQVPELYHVIPGGRAPEALRSCYRTASAKRFESDRCRSELESTSHFHIDPAGNLFTGLCAGIAAATADDLHPPIEEQTHPVFTTLCSEGPCDLSRIAERETGFRGRPGGYVSKCDLCFDVRRILQTTGRFVELQPESFYTVE